VYRTADQHWVAISCSGQSIFERSCQAIGRPELITDPRFVDNRARTTHSVDIDTVFRDWIAARSRDDVLTAFSDAGAAAAPVYDVQDAFEDPHFAARGNLAPVPDPELGQIRMQNVTPKLSRTPGGIRHAGPRLGQHTEEILRDWLDVDDEELKRLGASGVL
jgi:formyl-CoA transferase